MRKNLTQQIIGDLARKCLVSESNDIQVYAMATRAAVYLATGGFLAAASQILTHLWKLGISHPADVGLADRAMMAFWYASGDWPDEIPFAKRSLRELEFAHRSEMTGDRWAPEFHARPIPTDPMQFAFRQYVRAMTALAPTEEGLPSVEIERIAIGDLQAYYRPGFTGHDAMNAVMLLADLLAKHGRLEEAKAYVEYWQEAFAENQASSFFEQMPGQVHVAPLLLRGMLAERYELDNESVEIFVEAYLDILNVRMKNGVQSAYQTSDWLDLLRRLSVLAIEASPHNYEPRCVENLWLGREGASDDEIEEKEAELGVLMPTDFKEFLRTSDGFAPLNSVGVHIFQTSRIARLADKVPEFFSICEEFGDTDTAYRLRDALLLGEMDQEQRLLLVPITTDDDFDGPRWECWFYANWVPGEICYRSFRAYMENAALELEHER